MMKELDRSKLIGLFARLKGLQHAVAMLESSSPDTFGKDFNSIVEKLQEVVGEDLSHYILGREAFYGSDRNGNGFCSRDVLNGRLMQAVSWLEYSFHIGNEVLEIGTLYNAIKDEELKARCADLLSAPGRFDRVINQATLVLEDRIRAKAKISTSISGVALINKALRSDPTESPIVMSRNKDEHDGLCLILRGLVGAYRNPSHHQLLDHVTREEALKVCAFIDSLIFLLGQSEVSSSN